MHIKWTIPELVERFNASLLGQSCMEMEIDHLSTLAEGMPGSMSFFSNPKYATEFYQTKASAIFVHKDFKPNAPITAALIGVDNPYECFCMLITEIYQQRTISKCGVELPSYIGQNVAVGVNVYRGAFSYIGNQVVIGENVKIYPHVYIDDHVTIGDDTIVYSGAKLAAYTHIGKRCVIHSGAVVGSSGFGFLTSPTGTYKRIPAVGNVVLADDVEIGANTTIDAATIGKTMVGAGTKIDNLVQLAHNVHIGKHTGIAAQVGIAGSTKIGDYCRLGGQTGIAGHLHLGEHVTAIGRAGITKSFPKGHITLSGTPAFEHKKFLVCYAQFKNRL